MTIEDPEWPFIAGLLNAEETRHPISCQIKGQWPTWLSGNLYRIGPGIFDLHTKDNQRLSFKHWFDGLGMLHKFSIQSARVEYASRLTCESLKNHIETTGNTGIRFSTLERDPCQSIFQKFFSYFWSSNPTDMNINVTVTPKFRMPDGSLQSVIKTDANIFKTFDPQTLEMKETLKYDIFDKEMIGFASAAHEEFDPVTQSYINYNCIPGRHPEYRIFEVSPDHPTGRTLGFVKDKPFSYIHSFSSTKKYVILMAWPLLQEWQGLKIMYIGEFAKALTWYPDLPVQFFVFDRAQGRHVATFMQDQPFFCFHTINAFDEGDDIVIDLAAYKDAQIVDSFTSTCTVSKQLQQEKMDTMTSTLRRFRLSNVPDAVSRFSLNTSDSDLPKVLPMFEIACGIELPQINPAYRHKRYQYVYGISTQNADRHAHYFADALVKVNLADQSFRIWSQKGYTPGEPIFVAKPNAKTEDDGILLVVCLDGFEGKSMLVVLDACTFTEIASATVPTIVPFGFHGAFA